MAKKSKKAAEKSAALTPEEFQKLTPEEQFDLLNNLQAEKNLLEERLGEKSPDELPSVEIEDDPDNGIQGGTYQFSVQNFRHEGETLNVHDLMADGEGKDKFKAKKANAVIALLVSIGSGVLQRKED